MYCYYSLSSSIIDYYYYYSGTSEQSSPNDIPSNDQATPPTAATNSPIPPSHNIKSTDMLLKKSRIRADEIDELLVKSLNSLQEKKAKTVTID